MKGYNMIVDPTAYNLITMNREIPQGNKIIYHKMYRKERIRQLNRLQ
jgi:hypothetical protein